MSHIHTQSKSAWTEYLIIKIKSIFLLRIVGEFVENSVYPIYSRLIIWLKPESDESKNLPRAF